MEVQIINYDEHQAGGSIVSEFSVIVSGDGVFPKSRTMNFIKLLRSKKGKLYLAFPAKGIQRDGGKTDWIPYDFLPKEDDEELRKKIMEALKPFVKELALF